jgi:hypothetical protein
VPTVRQMNGHIAVQIICTHCKCPSCNHKKWKVVGRELQGIDLQCRHCGRFAEAKSARFAKHPASKPKPKIPGGSHAGHERQRAQGHNVDLLYTHWVTPRHFRVWGVVAEDQPKNLFEPRKILSGSRANYIVLNIRLSVLEVAKFRVIAERGVTGRTIH